MAGSVEDRMDIFNVAQKTYELVDQQHSDLKRQMQKELLDGLRFKIGEKIITLGELLNITHHRARLLGITQGLLVGEDDRSEVAEAIIMANWEILGEDLSVSELSEEAPQLRAWRVLGV